MPRWATKESDRLLAQKMVADGKSPYEVARELGYTGTTIRVWTDPAYAKRRAEQIVDKKLGRASRAKPKHKISLVPVP